jgi:hypothetical protein
MKSLSGRLILATVMLICFGCAASNISRIEEKWGRPAKIEETGGFIVYYYYFQKGKLVDYYPGDSGGITDSSHTARWRCVEYTLDKDGNIIKKRQYWVQPRLGDK